MGSIKRKTVRRGHETPRHSRFLSYIEEGHSQKEAARLAKVHKLIGKTLKQHVVYTEFRCLGNGRMHGVVFDIFRPPIRTWNLGEWSEPYSTDHLLAWTHLIYNTTDRNKTARHHSEISK